MADLFTVATPASFTDNSDGTFTYDDGDGNTTVLSQVGNAAAFGQPLVANYTALATDFVPGPYNVAFDTTAGALTFTLPDGLADGMEVRVSRVGANSLLIDTAAAETVGGDAAGATLNLAGSAQFVKSGTDWVLVDSAKG